MQPPSKPHPIIASYLAAAIALLPLLLITLFQIFGASPGVDASGEPDDAGYRSAGLVLAVMPFVYIGAVLVCYAVGVLLVALRLRRLSSFLGGAAGVGVALGAGASLLFAVLSGLSLWDCAVSAAGIMVLSLLAVLPAASCWWFLVVRPQT